MSVMRLGLAQTMTQFGARERENLDTALASIEQAGHSGVNLVVFAENFPGPFTEDNRFEVHGSIAAAAREFGVAVAYGTSLADERTANTFNIATVIVDEFGDHRGTYRRTHPNGPYIYRDSDQWNFDYVAVDDYPVIDLSWGRIGVTICSEVYLPEITRILAFKGAELCLFPSGLLIDELGYTDNWRTLVRARAIENLMYTATLVNLMDPSVADQFNQSGVDLTPPRRGVTRGIGMIASPEAVVAESSSPGLLVGDVDFDRVRELRRIQEELIVPAPYATIPGHLSWPRRELYEQLLAAAEARG